MVWFNDSYVQYFVTFSKIHTIAKGKANGSSTFMDKMLKHIDNNILDADKQYAQQLLSFLKSERYDTESVRMDLDMDGNINQSLCGPLIPKIMKQFSQQQQSLLPFPFLSLQ